MEQDTNISFKNRLRIAIFKLEDYGLFLIEKLSTSFKYLFLLILFMSIIMNIFIAFYRYKEIKSVYNYINNELPDFTFEDGKLFFDNYVEGHDDYYKFRLIIDTNENIEEKKLSEYKNKIFDDKSGLIFLSDKLLYITDLSENQINYNDLGLEISNKQDLLNEMNSIGIFSILGVIFISDFIVNFIYNFIFTIASVFVVASVGYMSSFFCKIKIRYSSVTTLSIYSLTLSTALSGIYYVVNLYTGFVITGFYTMYLFIAFIYIIASMFMIKTDLLKQNLELQKIIEVQKQIKDDQEEETEEENKDNNTENKDKQNDPEDNDENTEEPNVENREPDGSEI